MTPAFDETRAGDTVGTCPTSVAGTDHPRPDLRRPDWLSLDGIWHFAFDPDDVGVDESWMQLDVVLPDRIRVPYPWQAARSLLGPPPPDVYTRGEGPAGGGVGWYQRRVDVPEEWRGRRLTLVVGAAYWHTTVWVDSRPAGEHDGGYEPIVIDITDLVGERPSFTVTLRVWAPANTDEYPHGKNTDYWYTRVAGVWQSVYLEAGGAVAVREVAIEPDLATGRTRVSVTLDVPTGVGEIRVVATTRDPDDQVVAETELRVTPTDPRFSCDLVLAVEDPRPWAPEHPNLYDLCLRVVAADTVDEAWSYFGFRSVSFERTDGMHLLAINGEPTLVRGVMIQGYEADGLYTLDDDLLRADLEAARHLGFNLVRMHCKVEAPRFHYWADRLGMMLWCEAPSHLTPSSSARRRWEDMWTGMLARDRNHPSIVIWGMFIESWGLGRNQFGFGDAARWFGDDVEAQQWVEEMYTLGRRLDASRPIIENSVSEHDHTVAEVNDFHLFPAGYGDLPAKVDGLIEDFVGHARPGSSHNFAPGYTQNGQPLLASSCAGWSSVDGAETSWPLRVLLNAIRRTPDLAGFGWVQLYDVEWERTGLLDYRRRPKEFGYSPAEVTGADVLVLESPLTLTLAAGETTVVRLIAAWSSGRALSDAHLRATWVGHGSDGASALHQALTTRLEHGVGGAIRVQPLGAHQVTAPDHPFAGHLVLEIVDDAGDVAARALVSAEVLADEPHDPRMFPLDMWGGEDVASVSVGSTVQMLSAAVLHLQLPPGFHARGLIAELAVAHGPESQALVEVHQRPVEVSTTSAVRRVFVPEVRRSSVGALSQVHPAGRGAYGELVRLDWDDDSELVTIRAAEDGDRIVAFGARLGRYPMSPRLIDGPAEPATAVPTT